jgi:hypothetical protein
MSDMWKGAQASNWSVSEHMLEHEKAIATEEIRQEWMRRLRPMLHRQNPPAKKGKVRKRS